MPIRAAPENVKRGVPRATHSAKLLGHARNRQRAHEVALERAEQEEDELYFQERDARRRDADLAFRNLSTGLNAVVTTTKR